MGWRSVVIANPAALTMDNGALQIAQGENRARVMLEDISVLVLDHAQISLSAPLLSACAEAQIAVITVNDSHLPNGVLLPFLPHSRALKVMSAQLALAQPLRKRLWQRIVQHKIQNQAALLEHLERTKEARRLRQLAADVRSGDTSNLEAQAAQIYFPQLFQPGFHRAQTRFYNAALNYGYAVVRAAIARTLTAHGFLPAFGLFHHNEQNAFNLADDLIEPYRQLVDARVLTHWPVEPERGLQTTDKAFLVALLHENVALSTNNEGDETCSVFAAIEASISGLVAIVLQDASPERLALPVLKFVVAPEGEDGDDAGT